MRFSILSAGVLFLAVSTLQAQKSTAPSSGNTGTTGGKTPSTPSAPSTQPSNNPSQQPQQQQQMPVFLYGKVMMDDGTPPPASIAIKQMCTGSPRTVAFTSPNGQFNMQLGNRTMGSIFDASEGIGRDDNFGGIAGTPNSNSNAMGGMAGFAASLSGCELFADAPGFRSDRIDLTSRLRDDNPDIGMIVLHRIAGVEGSSISATSFNAPRNARKAWEKGIQNLHAVQTGAGGRNSQDRNDAKLASAEKDLLAAVTIYPKFATAWSDLGRARLMHQETDGAREAFLKAIEADSKLVEPYVGLGEQSMREKDWKGAAQYIGKALQLDPVDYPALWFEDAIANYNLQNWDRAEKDARQAVMLPPGKSDPHANELLGLILLNKRDYSGAKDALNTFLKSSPKPEEAARVRQQLDEIDRQLANNIH